MKTYTEAERIQQLNKLQLKQAILKDDIKSLIVLDYEGESLKIALLELWEIDQKVKFFQFVNINTKLK